MPTPDWTQVTVHGTYTRTDGSPGRGKIIFSPRPRRFVSAQSGQVIIARPVVANINPATGAFTATLYASDDPDITPANFSYNVREIFTGGKEYDIFVPAAAASTGGINIKTVAPLETPLPGTYPPITGGTQGPKGEDGEDGQDGQDGVNPILTTTNGIYSARPTGYAGPVIFVGSVNPNTLNVMQDGDTWIDSDDDHAFSLENISSRIDGVIDHEDVSGALELDSDVSTHWLDATAPTTITFTDGPVGGTRYVSIFIASGADDVTVDGIDATYTDGAFATFAWVRGAWVLAGAGGSSADSTPPSAVTDLAATPGEDGETATVTWTPAIDAQSTALHRLRYWVTSSSAGAWPTSGPLYNLTAGPVELTGLAPDTAYTVEIQSYSAGGSQSTTDTATFTTPDVAPSSYSGLVLSQSPSVYLRLGESSGTTAQDATANNRDGEYIGSPALGAMGLIVGDTDTAVTFDGTNDIVNVPAAPWMTASGRSFSGSLIIKPSTVAGTHFLMSRFANSGVSWSLSFVGANLYLEFYNSYSGVEVTGVMVAETTYHLGFSYDHPTTTKRLYINGVEVATSNTGSPAEESGTPLVIGGARQDGVTVNYPFAGVIDEPAFWAGTALTAADFLAQAEAAGLA